jgi:hypothetical protein
MIVGGVLYMVGALSYHRRRPDPFPSVFGYHEVFHAFVCAAATCQFVAIALFVSLRGDAAVLPGALLGLTFTERADLPPLTQPVR